MKHYILFTTIESQAIQNMSICIALDEPMNKEIKDKIMSACKYSHATLSPIGAPVADSAPMSLDEAIDFISKMVLYKNKEVLCGEMFTEVKLPDEVFFEQFEGYTDRVVIKLRTQYTAAYHDVVVKENSIISELIKMFPSLGYHSNRASFIVLPYKRKPQDNKKGVIVKYGIIAGKLIEYKQIIKYVQEEL